MAPPHLHTIDSIAESLRQLLNLDSEDSIHAAADECNRVCTGREPSTILPLLTRLASRCIHKALVPQLKLVRSQLQLYLRDGLDDTSRENSTAMQDWIDQSVPKLFCQIAEMHTRMLERTRLLYFFEHVEGVFVLSLQRHLRSGILSEDISALLHTYLRQSFTRFATQRQINHSGSQLSNLANLTSRIEEEVAPHERHTLHDIIRQLGLSDLLHDLVTYIIYCDIKDVLHACQDSPYSVSLVDHCVSRLDHIQLPWMQSLCLSDSNDAIRPLELSALRAACLDRIYCHVAAIRTTRMFDIIVAYPDCMGALQDIKHCVRTAEQRAFLVADLTVSIVKRLLSVATETSDILMFYVFMIRSLRYIDPTGVLLGKTADPIRAYLRKRKDTVRCIAEDLLSESQSYLLESLASVEEEMQLGESDSEEDELDEHWEPAPITTGPRLNTRRKRTADAVDMLVSIFRSRDIFIKTFKFIYSERLLATTDYDTENELRSFEILKRRFGDSGMHDCEVMIKDLADSKRFNQQRQRTDVEHAEHMLVQPIVLSRMAWPEFRPDTFRLPDTIVNACEQVNAAFSLHKPGRELVWMPQLGTVQLELELGDQKVEFNVSPLHATVIQAFQDTSTWTLDALSTSLDVPKPILRSRLDFWCSRGVLVEREPGCFAVQESTDNNPDMIHSGDYDVQMDEMSTVEAAAAQQQQQERQFYWGYINNLLRSRGSMPLDRIFSTLSMVLQGSIRFSLSRTELGDMLDSLVTEGQLEFHSGAYRLPRPSQ